MSDLRCHLQPGLLRLRPLLPTHQRKVPSHAAQLRLHHQRQHLRPVHARIRPGPLLELPKHKHRKLPRRLPPPHSQRNQLLLVVLLNQLHNPSSRWENLQNMQAGLSNPQRHLLPNVLATPALPQQSMSMPRLPLQFHLLRHHSFQLPPIFRWNLLQPLRRWIFHLPGILRQIC